MKNTTKKTKDGSVVTEITNKNQELKMKEWDFTCIEGLEGVDLMVKCDFKDIDLEGKYIKCFSNYILGDVLQELGILIRRKTELIEEILNIIKEIGDEEYHKQDLYFIGRHKSKYYDYNKCKDIIEIYIREDSIFEIISELQDYNGVLNYGFRKTFNYIDKGIIKISDIVGVENE